MRRLARPWVGVTEIVVGASALLAVGTTRVHEWVVQTDEMLYAKLAGANQRPASLLVIWQIANRCVFIGRIKDQEASKQLVFDNGRRVGRVADLDGDDAMVELLRGGPFGLDVIRVAGENHYRI